MIRSRRPIVLYSMIERGLVGEARLCRAAPGAPIKHNSAMADHALAVLLRLIWGSSTDAIRRQDNGRSAAMTGSIGAIEIQPPGRTGRRPGSGVEEAAIPGAGAARPGNLVRS